MFILGRVRAAEGSVTAPWVIVATDCYSVGPWRKLADEQVKVPFFNLATRPWRRNTER